MCAWDCNLARSCDECRICCGPSSDQLQGHERKLHQGVHNLFRHNNAWKIGFLLLGRFAVNAFFTSTDISRRQLHLFSPLDLLYGGSTTFAEVQIAIQ